MDSMKSYDPCMKSKKLQPGIIDRYYNLKRKIETNFGAPLK